MKSILDRPGALPTVARPVRDEAARNALVEGNMGLSYWCIAKLRGVPIVANTPTDLLEDAALDGLFRAAELWDAERSIRFCTYAVRAINSHILNASRKHANGGAGHGRRARKRVYLLADVWGFDHAQGEDDRLFEVAQPEPSEPPAPHPHLPYLAQALETLDDRERRLLMRKCTDGATLTVLANEEGLSRERVRQIVNRAKRRVKIAVDQMKGASA